MDLPYGDTVHDCSTHSCFSTLVRNWTLLQEGDVCVPLGGGFDHCLWRTVRSSGAGRTQQVACEFLGSAARAGGLCFEAASAGRETHLLVRELIC